MPDYRKTLDRLQALCSKRECCRMDIYRKALKALEGNNESAEAMVASLVEDGFVDDLRYSSAFAREKSRLSGWGAAKISFALGAKGIPKETVRKALEDVDQEEAGKRMRSVLETKSRTLKGDPHVRLKLLRFGLSRGYSYDAVSGVVDEILSDGENRR